MNFIKIAYIVFFVFFGLDILFQVTLYDDAFLLLIIRLIFGVFYIILSCNALLSDAQARRISSLHCLWALLGIIGIALYHIIFSRLHELYVES